MCRHSRLIKAIVPQEAAGVGIQMLPTPPQLQEPSRKQMLRVSLPLRCATVAAGDVGKAALIHVTPKASSLFGSWG